MKDRYENLKEKIGKNFEEIKSLAISQNIMEEARLEMNLKIIQAVVMRYIRIVLFQKKGIILCTSVKEIMEYVSTGFLRYFSKSEDRKFALERARRVELILTEIEKLNEELRVAS
ncbi:MULTISPECIES: hypothetical protein [unclassified Fusobacterium]|uniref:hypothetical protein n=1 Tax=unclassified Fusobacterium TaxID=2648384 RepID=UPI0025BC3CEA|nr:hypothetical protein [Fusobacterium sp.]